MNKSDVPTALATLFEFVLLLTALRITMAYSIADVIATYRVQSLILAGVTGFSAWTKVAQFGLSVQVFVLVLILVLPLFFAGWARWALDRATRRETTTADPDEAGRTWRDTGIQAPGARGLDLWVFFLIIALATLVAVRFKLNTDETIGLTVSLTLHLLGLFIMVSKRDLISQTIGLLVSDHGLYLAVVELVAIPVPAFFFVVGLWCYTLITLAILWLLVPQVRRRVSHEIDLDRIAEKSELKG